MTINSRGRIVQEKKKVITTIHYMDQLYKIFTKH